MASPEPNSEAPDGTSPQSAIVVRSIAEEYQWLATHLPGHEVLRQALCFFDDKPYDIVTVVDDAGTKRDVCFNVSAFYGIRANRGGPL